MFMVMPFVFSSPITYAEALLPRKWLDICLLMGRSELISIFPSLSMRRSYYSPPQIFSSFFYFLLLPSSFLYLALRELNKQNAQ